MAFLDEFVNASKDLEDDQEPTLRQAVPWLYKLKQHSSSCSSFVDSDSNSLNAVKRRAADLIDCKFCLQPLHYVAAVLNPKMKSLKMLDSEPAMREDAYQVLRETVTNLEQGDTKGDTTNSNNSEAASGETSPAHKKARFEDFEDDDDTAAASVDEVTQYLAMRIPHELTASLLHWWKATEAHLPKLAKVARRILAIPASSAPSERIFSAAGVTTPCLKEKLCQCHFLNNSAKHWPTLIIFGTQHHKETRRKQP